MDPREPATTTDVAVPSETTRIVKAIVLGGMLGAVLAWLARRRA
jgi:hypothetical protein